MSNQKKYYTIEYTPEIVEANSQQEAIVIAKQRIQDRDVGVDEENTCQVEDEDLLREIEEDERKADEEEARATAKPKKITDLKNKNPHCTQSSQNVCIGKLSQTF